MFSDVPNLASVFGYINASWTLKADLICSYVSRLIAYMDRKRLRSSHAAQPRLGMPTAGFIEHFSSGYMQRSIARLPKQGIKSPWRVKQNYFADLMILKYSPIANKALEFSSPLPLAIVYRVAFGLTQNQSRHLAVARPRRTPRRRLSTQTSSPIAESEEEHSSRAGH